MPPAKTILRGGDCYSSVTDFATSNNQIIQKPYVPPTLNRPIENKKDYRISTSPEHNETSNNYMDLNEFLLKMDKGETSDSNCQTESDPDYPKPTVDLLASLLTLGKMIQNQKQLIKNQAKQNIDSYSSSALSVQTDFSEHIDLQEKRMETSTDNMYLDAPDNFQYIQKMSPSHSSGSMSKRRVIPEDIKDIDYWDRRKRNNLAAKKSREERRRKELEIVETTKQLEKENSQLTLMLKRLTSRNEWLESRLKDIRLRRRTDNSMESSSLSSEES